MKVRSPRGMNTESRRNKDEERRLKERCRGYNDSDENWETW